MDVTKRGSLSIDEFIAALHLIYAYKSGIALPATLPKELSSSTLNTDLQRQAQSASIHHNDTSVTSATSVPNLAADSFSDFADHFAPAAAFNTPSATVAAAVSTPSFPSVPLSVKAPSSVNEQHSLTSNSVQTGTLYYMNLLEPEWLTCSFFITASNLETEVEARRAEVKGLHIRSSELSRENATIRARRIILEEESDYLSTELKQLQSRLTALEESRTNELSTLVQAETQFKNREAQRSSIQTQYNGS